MGAVGHGIADMDFVYIFPVYGNRLPRLAVCHATADCVDDDLLAGWRRRVLRSANRLAGFDEHRE